MRNFMLRNGFYGRGSEEGKEQAHNEFALDQQIVSRMRCPVKKTETFVRRQNSAVSPDLVPMLQSMKGKKRGPYNITSNRRQRRRIETVSNNSVRDLADGWVEVDHHKMNTSYLIKSSWKDVYMMCMYTVKKQTTTRRFASRETIRNGWPSSKRVIQDVEKVSTALHKISTAKGAYVPGLADRKGWRRRKDGGHGGKRVCLTDAERLAKAKKAHIFIPFFPNG